MAATRSENVAVILEMTAERILGRWLKYLLTFVAKNTDFNMASLTGLSRFNLSLHNKNRSESFVSKSFSYILNLGSINHSIPINCICWVPMTIKSEDIGLKLQNLLRWVRFTMCLQICPCLPRAAKVQVTGWSHDHSHTCHATVTHGLLYTKKRQSGKRRYKSVTVQHRNLN